MAPILLYCTFMSNARNFKIDASGGIVDAFYLVLALIAVCFSQGTVSIFCRWSG